MVASNYKTIDKETKEYCVTVSNLIKQRHGDLIAVDKLCAQEGHPREKKKKKEKLVQREVLSLPTVKRNGDTSEHTLMALNEPIAHYDQHKSPIIVTTSSVDPLAWPLNLTTSPSVDTLGTFYGSVANQDPKNRMPRPPFNVDFPDVQSSANHRVQEMDVFNADIHGHKDGINSGAEFKVIANVNRRAMIAGGMIESLRM